MALTCYAITANSLTAETFRQAPSSLIAGTGVVGSGDLAVTALSTPNMSVNVAAGQVWVPGTLSSTSGFPANLNAQTAYGLPSSFNEQAAYFSWNNGTVNLAIAAADPTNPRVDLVCVSVQDAQYSGSNNQAVLQVITGTPAPSPSAPSAPGSTVVLAQVAVAAGATSIATGNITDERPFARPLGVVPSHCRVSRGAAWTTASSDTLFSFDTVTYNQNAAAGSYNTGTGVFTCAAGGYYLVQVQIGATSSATAQWFNCVLYHNGSAYSNGSSPFSSGASQSIFGVGADVVPCAAGDTLAIHQLSSTAGLTGLVGSVNAHANFHYVGPNP